MISRTQGADSTLAFLREGYVVGARRFDELAADAFRTRMTGLPVTFLRGPGAAALVYDSALVTRRGAMPPSVQDLLQDAGVGPDARQVPGGAPGRHGSRSRPRGRLSPPGSSRPGRASSGPGAGKPGAVPSHLDMHFSPGAPMLRTDGRS